MHSYPPPACQNAWLGTRPRFARIICLAKVRRKIIYSYSYIDFSIYAILYLSQDLIYIKSNLFNNIKSGQNQFTRNHFQSPFKIPTNQFHLSVYPISAFTTFHPTNSNQKQLLIFHLAQHIVFQVQTTIVQILHLQQFIPNPFRFNSTHAYFSPIELFR